MLVRAKKGRAVLDGRDGKSAKRKQISMRALVWRGEVSAEAPGKGSFRGVCVLAGGRPAPSSAAGDTVDEYGLKPLRREVVRRKEELESESQNGNSGLQVICLALSAS
jgi:hypothetical protein